MKPSKAALELAVRCYEIVAGHGVPGPGTYHERLCREIDAAVAEFYKLARLQGNYEKDRAVLLKWLPQED